MNGSAINQLACYVIGDLLKYSNVVKLSRESFNTFKHKTFVSKFHENCTIENEITFPPNLKIAFSKLKGNTITKFRASGNVAE